MKKVVKTEASDNNFSINGGLLLWRELLDKIGLSRSLGSQLPQTKRNVFAGEHKFENLLLGFQAGNDHLDDWDELNEDTGFVALVARRYCAKSLGDFLRSFTGNMLHQLQGKLIELSLELRSQIGVSTDRFILDLDSTLHVQYGRKMEGVEFCYKKFRALDSILAFDELGLQYWHEVRPGSTYSSNGSGQIIHEVFSRIPKAKRGQRRVARGDSAFANQEFYNACRAKGVALSVPQKKRKPLKNVFLG